mmetsp:Transcript_34121/g.89585  ORF Transcript_34121/g.89585 Transcript_34121/m.89585 type:complete len:215 (+) Transcript_34121:264-908(+)
MDEATARSILGLPPAPTRRQLGKAFRRAALASHPDKVPRSAGTAAAAAAADTFRRVKLAYDTLLAGLGEGGTDGSAGGTAASEGGLSGGRPQRGPFGPRPRPPSAATMAQAYASFRRRPSPSRDAGPNSQPRKRKRTYDPGASAVDRPDRAKPSRPKRHDDRWGRPCGGCAECLKAASVPRDTVKKNAARDKFKDVAVTSRPKRHKRQHRGARR